MRVTIASKNVTARDNHGSVYRRCAQLTFRFALFDAGLQEMVFAPGVGPLRIVEIWIGNAMASPSARTANLPGLQDLCG